MALNTAFECHRYSCVTINAFSAGYLYSKIVIAHLRSSSYRYVYHIYIQIQLVNLGWNNPHGQYAYISDWSLNRFHFFFFVKINMNDCTYVCMLKNLAGFFHLQKYDRFASILAEYLISLQQPLYYIFVIYYELLVLKIKYGFNDIIISTIYLWIQGC